MHKTVYVCLPKMKNIYAPCFFFPLFPYCFQELSMSKPSCGAQLFMGLVSFGSYFLTWPTAVSISLS